MLHYLSREVGPFDLRVKQSLLCVLLFLLQQHQCLLHLLQSVVHIFFLRIVFVVSLVNAHELRLGSFLAQSDILGMPLDECLDFALQLSDPLHAEQLLERRVVHRVRNVWQCVISQEFACLGQVGAFGV